MPSAVADVPTISSRVDGKRAAMARAQLVQPLVVVACGAPPTGARRARRAARASASRRRRTAGTRAAETTPATRRRRRRPMPNAAARNPSGTAPTSPRNIDARRPVDGEERDAPPAGEARSAATVPGATAPMRGGDRVGGEAARRHRRREAVAAVHEVVEVRRPRDHQRDRRRGRECRRGAHRERSLADQPRRRHSAAAAWTASRGSTRTLRSRRPRGDQRQRSPSGQPDLPVARKRRGEQQRGRNESRPIPRSRRRAAPAARAATARSGCPAAARRAVRASSQTASALSVAASAGATKRVSFIESARCRTGRGHFCGVEMGFTSIESAAQARVPPGRFSQKNGHSAATVATKRAESPFPCCRSSF